MEKLPEPLIRLLEHAERTGGPVVADFRASASLQQDLIKWFHGDRKMARQFGAFGIDGKHALYALWFHRGVAPEQAPVVCLGADGGDSAVVAGDVQSFLSLLAAGDGKGEGEVHGLQAFRAWLKAELGLSPASDPAALVKKAQDAHPDLEAIVDEWSETNATEEGPSAEGWAPLRLPK